MKKEGLLRPALAAGTLLLSFTTFTQTEAQKQQITREYNQTELVRLQSQLEEDYKKERALAIQNALLNNLETKFTDADGSLNELQRIAPDGSPIYYTTSNTNAAISTRANYLNSGGGLGLSLDGQNMIGYVWDGGHARASHQEYDGPGGSNRVTIMDASSEGGTQLNYHAAHVTGTMGASGYTPAAKGMAWQAKIRGYMWNNDASEATSAAASGMLVSNHSYGFNSQFIPDSYFGSYITESRNWDNIMYNAPYYLMVVAAGNDGNANSYNGQPLGGNSSYDKLSGTSTCKNNLVVANAQDASISSNGNLNSVSINSSSSEGPTDDYRIKPDIAGNGTNVYSTYSSSNSAYGSISGTSMAAPNVAGSCLLLQQHYNNLNGSFMKSATLKGLVLHTADDAGSTGPDAVFGWGLMNSKRAAEAISNNDYIIDERTLSSGQSYSITVQSDNVNDLMASICWTDVPGTASNSVNNTSARLVNDLDIRITKNGTTYTPWRLTGVTTNGLGDNTRDPYERIDIANASGTYTITVTHKGSLSTGAQNFSLIVTGIGSAATADTQAPSTPTSLTNSNVAQTTASLNWNNSTDNVGVTGYQIFQGNTNIGTIAGNSANITGLTAATAYSFRVRAIDAAGNVSGYSNTTNFTTTGSTGGGNACSNAVGIPYSESFESTNNSWSNATASPGQWVRTSGTTPSSGTGPSTANAGSYYMFVEASGNGTGYPNINSNLQSPCIDLGSASNPKFSFDYHMNGTNNLGSIKLEVSANNGTSWSTIWSQTASQGSSWQAVEVDLASYAGQTLRFRFNRTTGNTWQADVAIDNVNIENDAPVVTYCASNGQSVADEFIQRVQISSINNSSAAGTGGYQNFTNLSANISGTTSITITPEWTGTVYPEGYAVWIDYNRDGDFTDAGELVYSRSATTNTSVSGSFNVPGSTLSGFTRMRVSMKYNGIPSSCESFSYGEVEDYTVNIVNNAAANYTVLAESEETEEQSIYSEKEINVNLYPNPVVDNFFNVSVTDFTPESYIIYSVMGEKIQAGSFKSRIDISTMAKGTYILQVFNNEHKVTKRFMKH